LKILVKKYCDKKEFLEEMIAVTQEMNKKKAEPRLRFPQPLWKTLFNNTVHSTSLMHSTKRISRLLNF
jgi:hypothetical protein